MTNKKLGLLLAPLIPLTAFGIVEVAREIVSLDKPAPVEVVEETDRKLPEAPAMPESDGEWCGTRLETPPLVLAPLAPQPTVSF